MIARASVKFKDNRIIFTDESDYNKVKIDRIKLYISIPGYNDTREVTINTLRVNIITASILNLKTLPDGVYEILFDMPDCPLTIKIMNTSSLDKCIQDRIAELVSCTSCKIDKKKKSDIDEAILLRNASQQMDCDYLDYYRLARELICEDCK